LKIIEEGFHKHERDKTRHRNCSMSKNITTLSLGNKDIILVGTAHVSKESVKEVISVISHVKPDRVCIEIDEGRYKALTQESNWKNLNITRVLKEKKGFLLFFNLVLASYQKRLGFELGIRPGAEMIEAVTVSKKLGIPFSLCDRKIQTTLKRAWVKSSFWSKNKMLAALLASLFRKETPGAQEIEELKKKGVLQGMMEELSRFLPSIKEVLIDERDIYLAAKIFGAEGKKIVAVVGAGHVPGITRRLGELDSGALSKDVRALEIIPQKKSIYRILPWSIPAIIVGVIFTSFIYRGTDATVDNIVKWILINGSFSAVGGIIALAHPLTIVLAFLAAPITSLVPVIGVGIFTGILEALLRKPRVADFENLQEDITSIKGFFKNRVTHTLIVFMLTNIGSSIGTFIGGIPLFSSLFG
jgi:pheromone shutdown-related protein TraB